MSGSFQLLKEVLREKRKMSREFDEIPLISPQKGKFSPRICALDGLTLVSNPVILETHSERLGVRIGRRF